MADEKLVRNVRMLMAAVKNLVELTEQLEARVETLENASAPPSGCPLVDTRDTRDTRGDTRDTRGDAHCSSLENNELFKLVSQKKEASLSGVTRKTRATVARADKKTIDELLDERDRELLGEY